MINHTKIFSLTIMLLFIKSKSNIWLFKFFNLVMHLNSEFMWFCDYRNPILCDLRRNPNCFYHQLNHFASGIIMYTLKETFHRITSLLRSKIVINEFELKLKNLGNIQGTFTINCWDVLLYVFSFFVTYIFQVFIWL